MDGVWRMAVLDRDLVDERELEAVLAWREFEGAGLLERLYRSALVSERALLDLVVSVGAQDGTAELLAEAPSPAALGALTREIAARCRAVPLRVDPPRLIVAMLDPGDTDALEEMAFFAGLAIEPRAVRASALFKALHDAYGVPELWPDRSFRSRALPSRVSDDEAKEAAEGDAPLPPPGLRLPDVRIGPTAPRASAPPAARSDPTLSPLAAGLAAAAGESPRLSQRPGLLDVPAPSAPAPRATEGLAMEDDAEKRTAGRDSLPPQVLPLLVPPFRSAVLFLIREDVAVGWDGRAPGVETEDVRGVLLPLTAESAFARAKEWGMVAAGTAQRPSTVERMFFRFLRVYPPETFAVLPITVGDAPVALLYVDKERGTLDDDELASARQVGSTLADGLAPLVADGRLFGPQGT